MGHHRISIDVDLDEFDDDIIDAVIDRGLVDKVTARAHAGQSQPLELRDEMLDALSALLRRDLSEAKQHLQRAVEALLPPYVGEALRAVKAGQRSDAICACTAYLFPSPAAVATEADLAKHRTTPAAEPAP
jgi:hypothetical protein